MQRVEAPVLKEFVATPLENGVISPSMYYPTYLASEILIHNATTAFQCSPWKLSALMGFPYAKGVYRWMRGERRMSALALGRLVLLHNMQSNGIPVRNIRKMNWDEGYYTLVQVNEDAKDKDLQPVS